MAASKTFRSNFISTELWCVSWRALAHGPLCIDGRPFPSILVNPVDPSNLKNGSSSAVFKCLASSCHTSSTASPTNMTSFKKIHSTPGLSGSSGTCILACSANKSGLGSCNATIVSEFQSGQHSTTSIIIAGNNSGGSGNSSSASASPICPVPTRSSRYSTSMSAPTSFHIVFAFQPDQLPIPFIDSSSAPRNHALLISQSWRLIFTLAKLSTSRLSAPGVAPTASKCLPNLASMGEPVMKDTCYQIIDVKLSGSVSFRIIACAFT
ncbi:unnamed protein product [Protopolystoma xenopodis]|uniref:Uncharacterized protein n=1 Tax=Protopolystoma xenopodis TaxID=117903 RepID=A0A3S5BTU9_9PLAT|nr:unnamed protein product [Protopolystoma xenopodis]